MATQPGAALASGVSFDEMLQHNEEETERWRAFFRAHPQALDVKVEMAQMKDVRGAVQHVFVVELLYAEVMAGTKRAQIRWEDFPASTQKELFSHHDRAVELMRRVLHDPDVRWDEALTFGNRDFTVTATRRKMFLHAALHGMRHWAQVAMVLRQNGHKQDWQHDFIFSKVME